MLYTIHFGVATSRCGGDAACQVTARRANIDARDTIETGMLAKFLLKLTGKPVTIFRRAMSLRNFYVNRIEIPTEMKVELTEVEDQMCVLFDDCSEYLRREKGINTTCRIAGGWVRDKVNSLSFTLPYQLLFMFHSYWGRIAMISTSHSVT